MASSQTAEEGGGSGSGSGRPKIGVFQATLDLIDDIVELYFFPRVIQPFLSFHEVFYSQLNAVLRKVLDDNKSQIPPWFTANFITYLRTWLVFPTLLLLAQQHTLLPALLVIAVDFGDFLDGVVARFWVDVRKEEEEKDKKKDDKSSTTSGTMKSNLSLTDLDVGNFEVVTNGSPYAVQSWVHLHRDSTYGGFIDAVCDKAYVVPCWISLTHFIPGLGPVGMIEFGTLFALILAETASACIRFRAFFTSPGVAAPKTEGFDFSTSAVKADHVGKAKQTFEMLGTALFIIGFTRYIGLLLLILALPLAYESVRRKVKKRVVYVKYGDDSGPFDHKTIKFWMQAKALGASKLIVGVTNAKLTDHIFNACASSVVDEVIVEAPAKADLIFVERRQIDYVLQTESQQLKGDYLTTEEVIQKKRVLVLGKDGTVRLAKVKEASKSD